MVGTKETPVYETLDSNSKKTIVMPETKDITIKNGETYSIKLKQR